MSRFLPIDSNWVHEATLGSDDEGMFDIELQDQAARPAPVQRNLVAGSVPETPITGTATVIFEPTSRASPPTRSPPSVSSKQLPDIQESTPARSPAAGASISSGQSTDTQESKLERQKRKLNDLNDQLESVSNTFNDPDVQELFASSTAGASAAEPSQANSAEEFERLSSKIEEGVERAKKRNPELVPELERTQKLNKSLRAKMSELWAKYKRPILAISGVVFAALGAVAYALGIVFLAPLVVPVTCGVIGVACIAGAILTKAPAAATKAVAPSSQDA